MKRKMLILKIEKYFDFKKWTKKMSKIKKPRYFMRIRSIVTIIEIYGATAEKIIFIL
jgi:hypothetical protein